MVGTPLRGVRRDLLAPLRGDSGGGQFGKAPPSTSVTLGRGIVEEQQAAGWGEGVLERPAADLRAEFPDLRGFSVGNIWRMRQFHRIHTQPEFLAQAVREMAAAVPWGHHVFMLGKRGEGPSENYAVDWFNHTQVILTLENVRSAFAQWTKPRREELGGLELKCNNTIAFVLHVNPSADRTGFSALWPSPE